MQELTAEIEDTLREYTQIQQEEKRIKERKRELQEKLKDHLRDGGNCIWTPEVGGKHLKLRYRSEARFDYDEEKLRSRLGARYSDLLEPDIKKLRTQLPKLESELKPLLDRIGSPSPEKVRAAVESGTVSAEEFQGAFKKTVKEYISVAALKG